MSLDIGSRTAWTDRSGAPGRQTPGAPGRPPTPPPEETPMEDPATPTCRCGAQMIYSGDQLPSGETVYFTCQTIARGHEYITNGWLERRLIF